MSQPFWICCYNYGRGVVEPRSNAVSFFFFSVNTVGVEGWCIQQAVCGNMGGAEFLGRGGKKEGGVTLVCLMPSQVKPYNNSVQDGLLLQLLLPYIV